jgi:hypothetical protein
MESSTMQTNADDHQLEHPGEWAISVAAHPTADPDEIARMSPYPGRWMRVACLRDIRDLGHDVVLSGEPPHADLVLSSEPAEALWEDLRAVFDDAIETPRYRTEDA